MRRLLLGGLLSAVAMFLWGFVFWGAGLGDGAMAHGANVDALRQALQANLPADGAYFIPDMNSVPQDVFARQHQEGPIATVFLRKAGADPMAASVFVLGFLHMFVSSLLIGWLLRIALPAVPTYGARVGLVLAAGLAATFWAHVSDPIWFVQPWGFHVWSMAYDLVAWALAGAILARFVTPSTVIVGRSATAAAV